LVLDVDTEVSEEYTASIFRVSIQCQNPEAQNPLTTVETCIRNLSGEATLNFVSEDEGNMSLLSLDVHIQGYTVSRPRKPQSENMDNISTYFDLPIRQINMSG
jgi:hypothetical protein